MELAKSIGFLLLFAVVVLAIFNFLKIFVLSKININKWIVLGIAIVAFLLPIVLRIQSTIASTVSSGLFVILLLWFMEIHQGTSKKKQENKVTIRPKAKPNRVKNMNKDKK
ncbi:hypothetical protein [Clostridium fungisolvens]|uniref:Uncharacterized protein n=1 Tax=Clostridium fungisolvens TaxID=1604897 RepID=A0A6V8SDS1_9CLOT|nr:hypothetical protein [Clostridium fungisolvens]GFP75210.1 hypothetical protein bsdtw1_01282 [Clostridium fungisolvens]